MSRHDLTPLPQFARHEVAVGWDRPLRTYFAVVTDPDIDDETAEGATPLHLGAAEQVTDPAVIIEAVRPYAHIPDDLHATLQADRDREGLGHSNHHVFFTTAEDTSTAPPSHCPTQQHTGNLPERPEPSRREGTDSRQPLALLHRPTIGGLVVPWITVQMPDGRYRFGAIDAHRLMACLHDQRCQICGQPTHSPFVFAMRDVDIARLIAPEPPMHPECATYSATACPMLAGGMAHYRNSQADNPAASGDPDSARARHPAHRWHLVWAKAYQPVIDRRTQQPAARIAPGDVLRVRPITPPTA
ncbi:hypothetical protein AB0C22_23715 [Micromonospora sp. NPDC048894]|uniref:hypothetical protein n=1 Tax=Micromonospora sp. NPDC048894 TaxID=3155493 RepID=UPI0033C702EC